MPKNIHHLTILQDSNKPNKDEGGRKTSPVANTSSSPTASSNINLSSTSNSILANNSNSVAKPTQLSNNISNRPNIESVTTESTSNAAQKKAQISGF